MNTRSRKSRFHAQVSDEHTLAIRERMELMRDADFVTSRETRNVVGRPPKFSKERFWYALMVCLLTTQQRSTKGTPVNLFVEEKPFSLSLPRCLISGSVARHVRTCIRSARGVRRGVSIAKECATNLRKLQGNLWPEVKKWHATLHAQRARPANYGDISMERDAARWAADNLEGVGPKQSRNLWQLLGLTRYEIPIDSRMAKWINGNLAQKIDVKRLGNATYYESVLNFVQAAYKMSGVLPCVFDAAVFDLDGSSQFSGRLPTYSGFVNAYGQITIRGVGAPRPNRRGRYQLTCRHCGHTHGVDANGIRASRCPKCGSTSSGS